MNKAILNRLINFVLIMALSSQAFAVSHVSMFVVQNAESSDMQASNMDMPCHHMIGQEPKASMDCCDDLSMENCDGCECTSSLSGAVMLSPLLSQIPQPLSQVVRAKPSSPLLSVPAILYRPPINA